MVDYGEDAVFTCSLANPAAGVVQVTLQKRRNTSDSHLETIATYSNRFGEQINDPYLGKVEWTASSSMSAPVIKINNATWSDDACYLCTFNIYPTGSQSRQTCLSVQGISNVRVDVQLIKTQPRELVVSCSATGKQVPVVSWDAAGIDLSRQTTSRRAEMADNTFTVLSNLTLTALPTSADFVYCLVDGGSARQRRERISLSLLSRGDEEVETERGLSTGAIVGVIVSVMVFVIIAIALKVRKADTMQHFIQQRMASCPKMTSNNTTKELEKLEEVVHI